MPERNRRELRVVAIGGGTGLSTLLKGLKKYTVSSLSDSPRISQLCAVVTVSVDGGFCVLLLQQPNRPPRGEALISIAAPPASAARRGQALPHQPAEEQ